MSPVSVTRTQHLPTTLDPASLHPACFAVPVVESDLSTVHVERTYDGHRDLLTLPNVDSHSSSSTARWSLRHRPALVHSVNRRCAVGTVAPHDGGR